ncbi:MAG TPA: PAS domain-containing protein, partial [Enterococcus aquimarinus]|nr:PAS domain-containing protein [Enterococcus aquimarinus]
VTFNPLKAEAIGYRKEHLPEEVGFEFFTEKIHPEDYEDVMDQMRAHLRGEVPVWEVKYRIQAKDGTWKTFYDRGKVTQRNAENKPL